MFQGLLDLKAQVGFPVADRFDVFLVEKNLLGKRGAGKDGLAGLGNAAKQAEEQTGKLTLQFRLG